jgi:hypothetical protein
MAIMFRIVILLRSWAAVCRSMMEIAIGAKKATHDPEGRRAPLERRPRAAERW